MQHEFNWQHVFFLSAPCKKVMAELMKDFILSKSTDNGISTSGQDGSIGRYIYLLAQPKKDNKFKNKK